MKREIGILKIASCILKKIFFNMQKNDICHEYLEGASNGCEKDNEVEEYVKNYQSTTRWQTV